MSGLYLWFPRRWSRQQLRPILLLNRKARGKARDFNWHHVFGFWMAIPLVLVVGSATVISFPWASDLAYRVAGDAPPRRSTRTPVPASPALLSAPTGPVGERGSSALAERPAAFEVDFLDPLLESAMIRLEDWRTVSVTVPTEAGAAAEFRIEQGWGGEPQKRRTLTFDAATGAELAYTTFQDESSGRRFRTFLRFAHTGEYFGLWGQTLAGLASLTGVILVWSGFALAWRRLVRPLLAGRTT